MSDDETSKRITAFHEKVLEIESYHPSTRVSALLLTLGVDGRNLRGAAPPEFCKQVAESLRMVAEIWEGKRTKIDVSRSFGGEAN